jgi:hypothetical protein
MPSQNPSTCFFATDRPARRSHERQPALGDAYQADTRIMVFVQENVIVSRLA